ncbi:FixH family protein [Mesobacillus maritimus]|uniref:FixH family protein n=1 Tax=Mesobacillus maritimus TaxID=1643336 RepID=UPI00203D5A26|nr:FixH family protein [Mesobacillus maritimus]MCM3586798.1 FixH family protein [Mesobacillus maritimus]
MKKRSTLIGLILLLTLAACSSSPKWEVEVTQAPSFIKAKEARMEISVREDGTPVSGLEITAELAMVEMDHGTLEVQFEEVEDGSYATKVNIPMAGSWEALLTMKNGSTEVEKVVELDVKEAGGVATINGEWITKEDVAFYQFINELHIEMARETDREKYTGEALDEAMAYWDAQEKMNENQNMLVAQIIRLRAMAMLGVEKGHQAAEAEIKAEVEKVRKQYEGSKVAQELIAKYGEEKFWNYQQTQYEKIVLTQKVQDDVIELVKEENPKASEQEVQFTAQKKYEELLVSQVDSLEIELL